MTESLQRLGPASPKGTRLTVYGDQVQVRGTCLPLKTSGHAFGEQVDSQPSSWDQVEVRVDLPVRNASDLAGAGLNVGDWIAFDSQLELVPGATSIRATWTTRRRWRRCSPPARPSPTPGCGRRWTRTRCSPSPRRSAPALPPPCTAFTEQLTPGQMEVPATSLPPPETFLETAPVPPAPGEHAP